MGISMLCCLPLAAGIIIGGSPNGGGNLTPFGGPGILEPGTRYQQAYAKADFSGPILITGIDFFSTSNANLNDCCLYAGTYQLSFSTITAGINTLSNTNFNANLGLDNAVFTTVALSGTAPPALLSFTGTPFLYNPSTGSLLLDIKINPTGSGGSAAFQARSGSATGTFSRYDDFNSTGVQGWGLVTQFDTVPEPATFVMLGIGISGLFTLVRFRTLTTSCELALKDPRAARHRR